MRYFVRAEGLIWQEVTQRGFVRAERSAGFLPKGNYKDDTLATAGFSGRGLSGKVAFTEYGVPDAYLPLQEKDR